MEWSVRLARIIFAKRIQTLSKNLSHSYHNYLTKKHAFSVVFFLRPCENHDKDDKKHNSTRSLICLNCTKYKRIMHVQYLVLSKATTKVKSSQILTAADYIFAVSAIHEHWKETFFRLHGQGLQHSWGPIDWPTIAFQNILHAGLNPRMIFPPHMSSSHCSGITKS